MRDKLRLPAVLLYTLVTWAPSLAAFEISGTKWPGAETEFHVGIEGVSLSGIGWSTAFISAAEEWNAATQFHFEIIEAFSDPCLNDSRNGVDFTATVCGSEFGDNTLAVTIRKFAGSVLGPANLRETDIVINTDVEFNVFNGPMPQFGVPGLDFRRVALHELGHAIGLDHEPSKPAIMAPTIGNLDRLQPDDIAGVNTLYGGLGNCLVLPLKLGNSVNALSEGDCRVNELTAGGGDDSFVDVYQFALATTTELAFAMRSETLDSVLLLADAELNILDFDAQSAEVCDSTLEITLGPGSYFLLANTFNEPMIEDCGISGEYRLESRFTTNEPLLLGPISSLLGDVSSAGFSGGISADNGISYGNVFASDESLDIVAEVSVDPAHQGQPGFLVVAALIDGEIFLMNAQRDLILHDPDQPLPRFRQNTLAASEAIVIGEDLVPKNIGIDEIEVDFVVGYGLSINPDEVYFHEAPFSLIVVP